MARTKNETQPDGIVITDADTPGLPALTQSANLLALIETNHSEDRDLVNQLLGQAQMADAFARFSLTVRTSKMAYVKENRLYRAMKGKKSPDGQGFLTGTWDEFCSLLGKSAQHVDEDLLNLRVLGEEALDSMSRMGIGYRELRQFRKLPDDQKAALIEVAKTGDKESFVELAEEIIIKHGKEKESLTQRAEEAEANLEARSRVLADKDQHINQLTEKMAKLEKRVQSMAPDDIGVQIRVETAETASLAEVGIRMLRASFCALADHSEQHGVSHGDFMAGLMGQLELTLRQLRSEFDIKAAPDGDDTPEWLRPGADDASAARFAASMAAAGWAYDAEGKMVRADTLAAANPNANAGA